MWVDGQLYAPGPNGLEPYPYRDVRAPVEGEFLIDALGWRFDVSGNLVIIGGDLNADVILNFRTGEVDLFSSIGPEAQAGGFAWTTGPLFISGCPSNDYYGDIGLNLDLTYGGADVPIPPLGLNVEVEMAASPGGLATLYVGGSPLAAGGGQLGQEVGLSYTWLHIPLISEIKR